MNKRGERKKTDVNGIALIHSYMCLHKSSENKWLLYPPCSHCKFYFLCHLTTVTVT